MERCKIPDCINYPAGGDELCQQHADIRNVVEWLQSQHSYIPEPAEELDPPEPATLEEPVVVKKNAKTK